MKAKASGRLSALRMVKAAIMNKSVEKGHDLDDTEVLQVIASLVKQRRDSIEQFSKAGRTDLVDKETAEIAVLEEFLPPAASPEDIDTAVAAAISETGATSPKDIGKVMKAVMPKLAGRNADGRTIAKNIAELQAELDCLAPIGNDPFRISADVIKPVLEKHRADMAGMEARLGQSFHEDIGEHRAGDVRDERDLTRPDPAVAEKIIMLLGKAAPAAVRDGSIRAREATSASLPLSLPEEEASDRDLPAIAQASCSDDTWSPMQHLPEERDGHIAVWTGAEMLVVGGDRGRTEMAAYDPAGDRWRALPAAPFPVRAVSAGQAAQAGSVWTGDRLVVWEVGSDQVAAYRPSTDSWQSVPSVGMDAEHGAMRWSGNALYAVGTKSSQYLLPQGRVPLLVARLDPDSESWEHLPEVDLSTPGRNTAAAPELTAWAGGRLIAWTDEGDEGRTLLAALKRFTKNNFPINTIAARQRIADVLIGANTYAF